MAEYEILEALCRLRDGVRQLKMAQVPGVSLEFTEGNNIAVTDALYLIDKFEDAIK